MSALSLYTEGTFRYTGGEYDGHPFPYRLLLPAEGGTEREARGEGWPLILFLHGAGERGSDNRAQLAYLPTDMASPVNREKHPAFVLVPQCPPDRTWSALSWETLTADFTPEPLHEARAVLGMLGTVLEEHPIDRLRIYLTGISMGGFGCWDLAAREPGRWAAVAPVCGGGEPKNAPLLKELPIWAFHGALDPLVPAARTRAMIEAIVKAGGSPRHTEFPDVGHDSWTPAYRHPQMLAWLFSQERPRRR